MDSLDTGKDKMKKICDLLKKETLEPAKKEGQRIIEAAQFEAHQILQNAEKKAAEMIANAQIKIDKEKKLFQTSLNQAAKQVIESLKQTIVDKLFNTELQSFVEKNSADPALLAQLITALVGAIEKEGTSADFSILVSKKVSKEQMNALLARDILDKLKEKSVLIGDFAGGIQLKLHDQKLTLDLSDKALNELLSQYLRKDFRDILFTNEVK